LLVSILIIALSLVMFVCWVRYTCLLILSTKTPRDYAARVAAANGLTFIEARGSLTEGSRAAVLEMIHRSLERDYSRVIRLLQNGCRVTEVENRIMMVDFRMMNVWYRVMRRVSRPHARKALLEMTSIVSHLANAVGEAGGAA
jgi:hypothetical protein